MCDRSDSIISEAAVVNVIRRTIDRKLLDSSLSFYWPRKEIPTIACTVKLAGKDEASRQRWRRRRDELAPRLYQRKNAVWIRCPARFAERPASQPASPGKMNYIGTWWCRLLTVAPLIGMAETCVRIPTRRQHCSTLFPFRSSYRSLACSRAFRVSMLELGRREREGRTGGGGGKGRRLIASNSAYSRRKKSTDAVPSLRAAF